MAIKTYGEITKPVFDFIDEKFPEAESREVRPFDLKIIAAFTVLTVFEQIRSGAIPQIEFVPTGEDE